MLPQYSRTGSHAVDVKWGSQYLKMRGTTLRAQQRRIKK